MAKKLTGFGGLIYSTNPDLDLNQPSPEEIVTLPAGMQKLKILLDKKARAGKKVTLVENFVGSMSDLEALSKNIKTHLGVGGSLKDGTIILQGDHREKTISYLLKQGYGAKQIG